MKRIALEEGHIQTEVADCPVFIYGYGKSGTSLMLALLDGHPEMVAYPIEPYFFGRYVRKVYGLSEEGIYSGAVELLRKHHKKYKKRFGSVSFEAHIEAYEKRLGRTSRSIRDHIAAMVLGYGDAAGIATAQAKLWVEKTPGYEKYARYVFSEWPQARCIHMIRDPRDTFISYNRARTERWNKRPFSVLDFAQRWRTSVRLAMGNQDQFGENRYLIVRYEDLVSKTEQQVQRIANFLNVEVDEAMSEPTRAGVPWSGNSMHGYRFKGISTVSIGHWQQASNPDDLTLLEGLLEREIHRFGYAPAFSKSLRLRFTSSLIRVKDWAERQSRYARGFFPSRPNHLPPSLRV